MLFQAKLKQFLSIAEVRRWDHRMPRCAILAPGASPFGNFTKSFNDQSLITFTRLDYLSFTYLLNKFKPLYYWYSPISRNGNIVEIQNRIAVGGRPWSLDAVSCLGLVIGCTRTRGSIQALLMIFGLKHSVLCLFLKFFMRSLFKVLALEYYTEVTHPSPFKTKQCK